MCGHAEEGRSGPIGQPVELNIFGDGGVADQVFSKLFGFGVEHKHNSMLSLQIEFKILDGIFFVDSYSFPGEHALHEIGKFFKVCLSKGSHDD